MPNIISAAGPRRKKTSQSTTIFTGSVDTLVAQMRPALPLYVLRPDRVAANAKRFMTAFPGTVMYAVKCNPDKAVMQTLTRAGMAAFDCASIEEIRLARKSAPRASIYYMHPVKSREAIAESYYAHNVRAFSLDCADELYKILQETDLAPDLELFVRIALPKGSKDDDVGLDLTGKFGANTVEAIDLLRRCRPVAARLGICFHVGSQCMNPARYADAIRYAAQLINDSGVNVDILDVGGGFPVTYPDQEPADLSVFMTAITDAVNQNRLGHMDLICEPGRAMVADAGSLVVRVEQRRGDLLHINDGTYGSLFDAGKSVQFTYATRLIRPDEDHAGNTMSYRFAGPTCDSIDMMDGPFILPADMREGDWIEISMLGAYCTAMRTQFNGFGRGDTVLVDDRETTPA